MAGCGWCGGPNPCNLPESLHGIPPERTVRNPTREDSTECGQCVHMCACVCRVPTREDSTESHLRTVRSAASVCTCVQSPHQRGHYRIPPEESMECGQSVCVCRVPTREDSTVSHQRARHSLPLERGRGERREERGERQDREQREQRERERHCRAPICERTAWSNCRSRIHRSTEDRQQQQEAWCWFLVVYIGCRWL